MVAAVAQIAILRCKIDVRQVMCWTQHPIRANGVMNLHCKSLSIYHIKEVHTCMHVVEETHRINQSIRHRQRKKSRPPKTAVLAKIYEVCQGGNVFNTIVNSELYLPSTFQHFQECVVS